MAELVDAPASGAGAGNGVEVRVLFRAPFVLCVMGAEGRAGYIALTISAYQSWSIVPPINKFSRS